MKTEEWVILIVFVLVAIGRFGGMNKDGSDRGDTGYEDIRKGSAKQHSLLLYLYGLLHILWILIYQVMLI